MIKVRKRTTTEFQSWEWMASIRPPLHERITTHGYSFTRWGGFRKARRELRRLLRAQKGSK